MRNFFKYADGGFHLINHEWPIDYLANPKLFTSLLPFSDGVNDQLDVFLSHDLNEIYHELLIGVIDLTLIYYFLNFAKHPTPNDSRSCVS